MLNNRPRNVRERAASAPQRDRRVVRTRVALGHALVELMLEREFDEITVQQVLDRANVGRATFYAHFKDKRDLLLSDAERFLEMLEEHFTHSAIGTRRVAPVTELFAHVADVGEFPRVLDKAGLLDPMLELFTGHLARIIERRVAELAPRAERSALSDSVMSRVFAGGLVELLRWWMRRASRPTPQEMDDRFHEIVWSGLARMAR
jgi:AcrR family transcriptional regulator